MNILITGASGFIANYVLQEAKSKDYTVIGADRISNDRPYDKFYQVDLTHDESVKKIFEENNIDFVIHLAGQIDVLKSEAEPLEDAKDNIMSLLTVLKYAKNIKRFIFSSTAAVYGDALNPNEETALNPLSNYGLTKELCEKYIKKIGVEYTIFRFSNVYGKGGRGLISRLLENKEISISQRTRDFIFVNDVAKIIVQSLENEKLKNDTFNLSTNIETSIEELSKLIPTCKINIIKPNANEITRSKLSNKKLLKCLDFNFIQVKNGIKELHL